MENMETLHIILHVMMYLQFYHFLMASSEVAISVINREMNGVKLFRFDFLG